MSEAKHTPEPWQAGQVDGDVGRVGITAGPFRLDPLPNGIWVQVASVHRHGDETQANADRIVACVNAMAGIDDPADLRRQRDKLLAALSAPLWLVWSNEHAAWWGPNRCHYYRDISAAGRYTLEEATEIAGLRIGSQKTRETGNPGEMIQPSPEWVAMRAEAIREATQSGG